MAGGDGACIDSPRNVLSAGALSCRTMFIKVDSTPNPDALKFIPEAPLVDDESFTGQHYRTVADARNSKLVRELLRVPGISSVFVSRDFISVNKSEHTQWDAVRAMVLHLMLEHLDDEEEGGGILQELPPVDSAHVVQDEDDEIVAAIKELMETRIRPAVQEDGGDIFFVSWDEGTGTVRVRMAGSCVGCPSSTVTLRNGVENMLQHYVPEVEAIEAVDEDGIPTDNTASGLSDEEPLSIAAQLAKAGVPGAAGPIR